YVRPLTDPDFLPGALPDPTLIAVSVAGAPDVLVPRPPRPSVWQVQPGYALLATGPGNGGVFQLALGPLPEDSVVVVQAHKDHSAVVPVSSDLQLQQAVVILIRPAPVPGLLLQLTPS